MPGLQPLYNMEVRPRHGEVVMIAGRSGTQKSGFALWWMAQMGLPTLYFSADMSPFTASARIASMFLGEPTESIEERMARGGRARQEALDAIESVPMTFAFGQLNWQSVDQELESYVELWDSYPQCVVFDNLMDFEGAEADYSVQMNVMSNATAFARETGATTVLLHHASDKSWDAKTAPYEPPSRNEVKGGLSEKPELSLSVALDPNSMEYKIACIKQRMGPSDPTARRYAVLRCQPELTRFHAR
ncbi:AAA family ATPase [Micromonospora sp. NBC_01813]|uniref:AAA family ATPase n=1 Tax=Micromonospora sp. NBC_01813 TaxID=2975988 RepID=UPI002DDC817D|nr:AAA family ATPase [Micromonospora sp. NBC_01813]WSA11571.1 AAA family ATPase [Micromonospora sp. NBC_01813]